MQHTDVAGHSLAHRSSGQGTAVLFLHNGGTSSTIWRHQMEALSDRHRVVAVDLPGFGDSPRPTDPLDLNQLVELVAAFIETEQLSPAVVVGNCMGTNIAALLARRHPSMVSAVLAINPLTAATFSAGRIGVLHRMEHVAGAPTRALRSLSRRVRTPRSAATASLRFQVGDKGAARRVHHDPELVACQLRADQLPALIDVLDDMDTYGTLDRSGTAIAAPVWIVWGDQNRVLSRHRGGHLPGRLGAARVEVLTGCGHLPMLEDPDTVTGLITDLIGSTSGDAALGTEESS